MKKFFFIAALFLSFNASAQVQMDKQGNYFMAEKVKADTMPATFESLTKGMEQTGKTFTDSTKKVWQVFKSKAGIPYAIRQSKKGNWYKFKL